MKKLYRKLMAEVAEITPTQLDYLVKLGAVSPDKGGLRKHFSLFEASLVVVAGQLMPFFKDQRTAVEAVQKLRASFMSEHPSYAYAIRQVLCENAYRDGQDAKVRAEANEPSLPPFTEAEIADRAEKYALSLALSALGLPDPTLANHCQIDKDAVRQEINRACLSRGWAAKSIIAEATDDFWSFYQRGYRSGYGSRGPDTPFPSSEAHRFYFEALQAKCDDDVALMVSVDQSGSALVLLDFLDQPARLGGVNVWLTLDLNRLFQRLHPYSDGDLDA